MTKPTLYEMLGQLGVGMHRCPNRLLVLPGGWLELGRDEDGNRDAMWCTGKTTHQPLDGTAFSVKVDECDAICFVTKAAITMHEVRDDDEKIYWYDKLYSLVSRMIPDG